MIKSSRNLGVADNLDCGCGSSCYFHWVGKSVAFQNPQTYLGTRHGSLLVLAEGVVQNSIALPQLPRVLQPRFWARLQ